jgi:hypothetical protein
MDLLVDVKLKNTHRNFMEYIETVRNEQLSSVNYLKSADFKWHIPDSLKKKVDLNGFLKPYFGDTVVIKFEDRDISILSRFQDDLRLHFPDLFAEPLDTSHFHITLHDLKSGPEILSLDSIMEEHRIKCEKIFKDLSSYFKEHQDHLKVTLKPAFIYPCCNISMVFGFTPMSDRDFRIIMNLYNLFDNVVYLDYWLRLHVTLSYFKIRELTKEEGEKLYGIIKNFMEEDFSLTVDLRKLAYQRFFSMNEYRDLFLLSHFM